MVEHVWEAHVYYALTLPVVDVELMGLCGTLIALYAEWMIPFHATLQLHWIPICGVHFVF